MGVSPVRVRDSKLVRLAEKVADVLASAGYAPQPMPVLYTGEFVRAPFPVLFKAGVMDLDDNALSSVAYNRTMESLRYAVRELDKRSADVSLGFRVAETGCLDLSLEPGWTPDQDRYVVFFEWNGPKPTWWPYAVKPEDTAPVKDEDVLSDYDWKVKYGESPEEMLRRHKKEKEARPHATN